MSKLGQAIHYNKDAIHYNKDDILLEAFSSESFSDLFVCLKESLMPN